MTNDAPLNLTELSQVDEPDVVRAALRHFRRRTLLRGVGFAAIVALVLWVIPMWVIPRLRSPSSFLPRRYAAAPAGHVAGRVVRSGAAEALVLDAKRLDAKTPVLHVIVKADGLKPGETLGVDAVPRQSLARPPGGEPPFGPPRQFVSGPGPGTPVSPVIQEMWIELDPGTFRLDLVMTALTEGHGSVDKGPGTHTQEECAEPLNPLGVCELLKIEGRRLVTIELDLAALGIPESIWR